MFSQRMLDRSVLQTRDIFNKYIYRTDDTMLDVLGAGYFAGSRFIEQDGEDTNGRGWIGGVIECQCADGYVAGRVTSGGTIIDVGGETLDAEVLRYISEAGGVQMPADDVIVFSGSGYDFNLLPLDDARKTVNLVSKDGTITIKPDGTETVVGASEYLLTANEALTIGPDGNNWLIMG